MIRAVAITILLLSFATAFAAQAPKSIAEVDVPSDGTAISLPKMRDAGTYRVRLIGTFACAIDDRRFDARYREDDRGKYTQPHNLLIIDPGGDMLIDEDAVRHIYEFGPLKGDQFGGESVTVRLDIDRLVDEFIRTPTEVRESLSGRVSAELLYAAPTLSPSVLVPAVLIPVLLVGLVLGLMVQASRRSARRPYEDVNAMRRRIRRKAELALAEMDAKESLFDYLRRNVADLSEAADGLAEHVITYRGIKLEYSPHAIEDDIKRLEKRLASVASEEVAAEYREEIENKRRTLDYIRANEDREASYLARLSQTETALDNLRLRIPDLRTDLAETAADRPAASEIDRELALLKEAVAETRERVMGPA